MGAVFQPIGSVQHRCEACAVRIIAAKHNLASFTGAQGNDSVHPKLFLVESRVRDLNILVSVRLVRLGSAGSPEREEERSQPILHAQRILEAGWFRYGEQMTKR